MRKVESLSFLPPARGVLASGSLVAKTSLQFKFRLFPAFELEEPECTLAWPGFIAEMEPGGVTPPIDLQRSCGSCLLTVGFSLLSSR